MSANTFGRDWAQLEAETFRSRDPLSKERRFIPIRLDDAPARGSLGRFIYVDWRGENREEEYAKLLDACKAEGGTRAPERGPTSLDSPPGRFHDENRGLCVRSVAWDGGAGWDLSGAADGTVRLWDVDTGSCMSTLEGHEGIVNCVACLPKWPLALSGSSDRTLRVWDTVMGLQTTPLASPDKTPFLAAIHASVLTGA